ncbi:hypothetical protein COCOBI_09-3300 [Coccomyxa sp. Obi]|nr:hypothetical protein COCOBI_09-3300 [Coccomyxa sp. Obi]
MEDIIIYSVGALAVRGLRRAVFGPSREEKLSQEVKQLQGVIAQQNARLQQLEETLMLPAAQVPQDPLVLALPGRLAITSAGETANGRRSPLKRPAPDGPSDDAAPVAKRSRWSIFPVARRRSAEEPAQPPSSPSPSNRAAVVQSSSNPSTSTDQSASADMTETSESESSGTSSGSDEESSDSDAADDSCDEEESSSEGEGSSDEDEASEAVEDCDVAVSASATTSGSESESEPEDEPSQAQDIFSKKSTSGSSGSSGKSTSQTPSTNGPSSSSKELSQAVSEAKCPESSEDPYTSDDSCPASSVPDCTQRIMEALKSVDDHSNESEALSSDSTDDSDDSSSDSDSDSKSEGSKDTEDSSHGDSDSKSEEVDAVNAAVAPVDQPALPAAGEQAALVSPTEDQGAGEVEVDDIEEIELQMGPEEEVEVHREAQNRILCQVQEQIASAIYDLHIADSSLGEAEIMSDLQQMAAGLLPDSPQDATEQPKQEELPEQPLLSSDDGAAATAALSGGVHMEEPADRLVADSTPSDSKNIEDAAANMDSPTAGSPFVTVAATWSPTEVLDERSGGESRARRSPKRPASGEDMSGEERRSRKRPRTLCSRLFSYLPRPLRTLKRFGGRSYWRGGARRRASSTSDSSQDQAARAPEPFLVDPAAGEEQATSGTAVMEQGSVFLATPDAKRDEAADAATPEDVEPAQHEATVEAACSEPVPDSSGVPIQASGIFLTEDIAADDELSEEEKALLALADAEEQARMAIARFTQAPATQDITPAVDSHIFALGSPQKAPVDEEWGDLSPTPAVYGSNPAAAYSPSLCRQQDYSGLSQDEYARSLSPIDRRSRSRSRSEHHPNYSCGRSLSPRPGQGHEYPSDLSPARRIASLSPLARRSFSEPRNVSSPIRSPSPRRSGLAQEDRSIPSLSPFPRRSRSRSVSNTSRSHSHSRDVSRGRSHSRSVSDTSRSRSHSRDVSRSRGRSRQLSGPGRGRNHSSSPSYSPTKRSRSCSPRRFERHEGTPSRSRSSERAGRSLSRGHSHGNLSPMRRPRRRSIARSRILSSQSPSRSLSCGGGRGRDSNEQSPRWEAASASPSRRRSPTKHFHSGSLEKKLGSPSYSSYKKSHSDTTDGELRQLVRDCEDLKAKSAGDVAAHKAAMSPSLSQPGGRKRGVLLSPSRSPSPITSSPFSHPGGGIRLTDLQDTGYDVMGDGAEDRDQLNQDVRIIRDEDSDRVEDSDQDEDLPVQSDPLDTDAVGTIHSPDLRKLGLLPSPSPDLQHGRIRFAIWNPSASDASQHLRSVSRSRSRSGGAFTGFGRSRGSPCKAQEPPSPQAPSVLLSDNDADGDALLQWRSRPGTPVVPDDSMVQRAVHAALHSAEQPERGTLATHLARGLADSWQHEMHRRRPRAAGSDDDQAPREHLFRRRMRFARRIFERHRRRAPASVPVVPHLPLFSHSSAPAAHRLTPGQALFRRSVASSPAWMPMADFGNDSVEELVDLTQDDIEEDRQQPQPPTGTSPKDPQSSYAQPQAGNEYVARSDVDTEAPRRPATSEADLCDAELEMLLQQDSG